MKKLSVKKFYKKKKSPSNSRSITEKKVVSAKAFIFLVCFVSGILLMVILLEENNIRKDILSLQNLNSQRMNLQTQVLQWQHIMTIYPDYRDGDFHLAILEYQLGNMSAAQMYNQQVLHLDPNFKQGRELETKL